MAKRIALYSAVALGILGIAAARAEGPDLIATRQAGLSLTGGDFAFIRSVVQAKGDVKPLEVPARAIAKWAAVLPSLFPAGTDKGGNTKALAEIWSDPSGFKKDADNLGTAAIKLADAAKAGDADAVAAATKSVGEACGACHKSYRAK